MSAIHYQTHTSDEEYRVTIRGLRAKNFSRNLPFLILSDKLPEGQVYREFPDGRIELQQIFTIGAKFHHKVLSILPEQEALKVRKAYGL